MTPLAESNRAHNRAKGWPRRATLQFCARLRDNPNAFLIRSRENDQQMVRYLLALLLLSTTLQAQTNIQQQVRSYRRANEQKILKEFTNLLAIPNVAADNANIRRNAALIVQMMNQRGLNPRLLEAKSPGAPPAVYGEWKTPGATKRYCSTRTTTVNQPIQRWTGTEPWKPVFRSAAHDQGGQLLTVF